MCFARHVLDLGCGSCDLVRYLAETCRQQVTGVDIASDNFPKHQKGARFHCIRRDATRLSFASDGSFDAIVTTWALHEMERARAILAEARRVLRPGGKLLVVDFPKDSLAQRLWNEDYYCPEQVERLLTDLDFSGVSVRLIERNQVVWACARKPARENTAEVVSKHAFTSEKVT